MSRIAVVGAGVVGLTAALSLGRRGHHVTTFDPEPPGTGQSFGRVRAFRVAHPTRDVVKLATEALAGWRAWQEDWGVVLLAEHGLLISDPDRAIWAAALAGAGEPYSLPDLRAAELLCPLINTRALDPELLLFDPQAGAIDVRASIEWLLAATADHDWRIVHEHVSRVIPRASGAVVVADDRHEFDAVIVAAGAGTEALAESLGLYLHTATQQRTWASMLPRESIEDTAMWMQMLPQSRYGWAQLGPDGAVALSGDWSSVNPQDTSAGSMSCAVAYAQRLMPCLDPDSARPQELQVAPVTVPGGWPFAVSQVGQVTLIEGNQLFKFAPVLGEILADAVAGVLPPWVPEFGPL